MVEQHTLIQPKWESTTVAILIIIIIFLAFYFALAIYLSIKLFFSGVGSFLLYNNTRMKF